MRNHKYVLKQGFDKVRIYTLCLLFVSTYSVSCTVKDTTKTITDTTKKIAREITFADDPLKKVIAVAGFENRSLHEHDDFQTGFHKDLIEFIRTRCDDLIVVDSDADGQAGRFTRLPKLVSGQTDNYALAVIGRQIGANAIVAGSLTNIRPMDEERGILWTKDTHYLIEVMIQAAVYDTLTATKIIDKNFPQKFEIDESEYMMIRKENAYHVPQINQALRQVVSEMGEQICEAVAEQKWSGYVTSVEEQKITISIGGPVGLEPGHILEVFDSGRVLEGIDGQRFVSPGLKTAEIKVISVSDRQAEAVKVSGRGLKKGSIVRKK